jgi:acyl transferase domain-containing protein/phosphopantetheinyl transferase
MSRPRGDVAVIGMACIFPKASNLSAFWGNILGKVDAITDPPSDWGSELVYAPDSEANDRIYTKRGGFLAELSRFNPLDYGIMPKEVDGGEPEHFLALRVAHDALNDAGYLNRPFPRERTQVILGRGTYVNRGYVSFLQHGLVVDQTIRILAKLHPEHSPEELESVRAELKASLPPFSTETAPSLAHSVMCGRIANRLNLMGAAFTVDAACASSLVAVDLGIKDLLCNNCDLVLAGGVQVSTTFPISQLFCQLGALSRKGQLRPFHTGADGTLLGEGVGIVVLKRIEDAKRDSDRVYAIVKNIGIASDGKALGVLAPRLEGEVLAMRRAYESQGISPQSIGMIEAHGTGTPVGDATEIAALTEVFGEREGDLPTCALGSVKSMIGHCIPAAGIAGFIKAALALYHKVLPPTLHCDSPGHDLERTRFYLNTETRPWIHSGLEPRRAAVNAFGFGGINTHAILEEAPDEPSINLHPHWDCEVFILAADSREELVERANQLRRFIAGAPTFPLHDLAYAINSSVTVGLMARLSIVAVSFDELDKKLAFALERLSNPNTNRIKERSGVYYFDPSCRLDGKLAFLFPGEGSQYPGMLSDLCVQFSQCRNWFELMDRAFRGHPRGFVPSQIIFPPQISNPEKREELSRRLWNNMDIAIEAVFAANQSLCSLLRDLGLQPAAVAGHSTGEYSALMAAGAIHLDSETELIRCILDGNQITQQSIRTGLVPERTLLAVGPARLDLVHKLLEAAPGSLYLAMDNCPHQAVICGTEQAITSAQNELRANGVICQRLPFGRAYHTPLFAEAGVKLREFFHRLRFVEPRIPIYSCATASPFPKDPAEARVVAEEQWARPVRFRETIEAMYADGVRIFIEAGPRGNLIAFVEDILGERKHLAVAANVAQRSGLSQINHLIGLLSAYGIPLNLDLLYARRARRLDGKVILQGKMSKPTEKSIHLSLGLPMLELKRTQPEPKCEHPNVIEKSRHGDSQASAPGRQIFPSLGQVPSRTEPRKPEGATSVVTAYFRNMERFLDVQQSIVGSFLENDLEFKNRYAYAGPAMETRRTPKSHFLPFIGEITKHEAGTECIVLRELSIDDDIFLHHHALGPRISDVDPNLLPLPVFPLALSVEMMVEAASLVVPGINAIEIRKVRAHRWITLDSPRLLLRAEARISRDKYNEVDVEIRRASPETSVEGMGAVLVEGSVYFGEPRGVASQVDNFRLRDERLCTWTSDQLYADSQRHGMFHGPTFQGVISIDRIGSNGAEATLRTQSTPEIMFQSKNGSTFLVDPLLLDAAGQVLGFWAADWLDRGRVVFPIGFEKMCIHTCIVPWSGLALCRVEITEVLETTLSANLEVVDTAGNQLLSINGWKVKRFHLPEHFYAFRLAPAKAFVSVSLTKPLQGLQNPKRFACRHVEFPGGFLEADGGIWRECLAHLLLSPRERTTWRALGKSEERRTDWLLGRLVAKDAIRLLVNQRLGTALYPADIDITAGEHGQPVVGIRSGTAIEPAPIVSIAHSHGAAVAVATDDDRCLGLGIDIDRSSEKDDGFEIAAFTEGERTLFDSIHPKLKKEWLIRTWCAKEAVAKALGCGLVEGPGTLLVKHLDLHEGAVKLGLSGALAGRFPEINGTLLTAHTAQESSSIFATATRERS